MADRITDALRGIQPVPQADGFSGDMGRGSAMPPQDGSEASGYATPDLGPFECENCTKFQPIQIGGDGTQGSADADDMGSGTSSASPGQCGDPRVQQDPEVQGQVDAQGCCNFFQSAHNETQQEEHGEENGEAEPNPEDQEQ